MVIQILLLYMIFLSEYLVRACISDGFAITNPIFTLNFNDALQRVYLAEVMLYNSNRPCSHAVLNESVSTISSTLLSVSTSKSNRKL